MSCCFGARPSKNRLPQRRLTNSSIPKGKREIVSDDYKQKVKPKQKISESPTKNRQSSKQVSLKKVSQYNEGIDEDELALVMNFNFDIDTLDGISAPISINHFRYQSVLNHLPPNQMGCLEEDPKLQSL